MKIAIPVWDGNVSPVLDTAERLLVVEVWQGEVVWGGVVALLDWVFDMMDGRVARLMKQDSKLGAFFDFISDRLRLIWLVALAFGSVISFPLALIALLLDSLLHLISHFVDLKGLKYQKWLPNNIDLVTIGALINQVPVFIYIKLVLGSALLVLQVVSVFVMNRDRELEHENTRT